MTDSNQLQSIRCQASILLAFSVLDLFPNTQLISGKVTNVDLYYDFIFEKPFSEQALLLVEERWRKWLKEFDGFEYLEMMRENAASLFEHHHQLYKADLALNYDSNIIPLVRLENFYEILPGGMHEESHQRIYPKIFSFFNYSLHGQTITRLEASAFLDQDALKAYQKKRKQGLKLHHARIGEKLELFRLFDSHSWLFFPRGERIKQKIEEVFFNLCEQERAPLGSFSSINLSENVFAGLSEDFKGISFWGKEAIEETGIHCGLLDSQDCEFLRMLILGDRGNPRNSCISSLQFIQKIIKIFDLNHEWVLRSYWPPEVSKKQWQAQADLLKSAAKECGINLNIDKESGGLPPKDGYKCSFPRLEMCVYDALGKRWPVSLLGFAHNGKKEFLSITPLVSLERLIALLLEQSKGKIPPFLLPEQVRIIPLSKENKTSARAVQLTLISHHLFSHVDAREETLAKKIELAVQHQVPYIMMLGSKEEKNGLVAVRQLDEAKTSEMKLEDFVVAAKQELERKLES
ncbi:MAG: His/Gly/Thr/Pro-type tRNA ligase C-terminal domain-containing protein [Parachlamydiaceae bacterium]